MHEERQREKEGERDNENEGLWIAEKKKELLTEGNHGQVASLQVALQALTHSSSGGLQISIIMQGRGVLLFAVRGVDVRLHLYFVTSVVLCGVDVLGHRGLYICVRGREERVIERRERSG